MMTKLRNDELHLLAEEVADIIVERGLLAQSDIPPDDIPPAPVNLKDRKWKRLSGTLDSELYQRFEEERGRRRVSISRMLDIVLWRGLGRPTLSYQPDPID
jgi:hypothetical protein